MPDIICPNCRGPTEDAERHLEGVGSDPVLVAECTVCGFNTTASTEEGVLKIRTASGHIIFTHEVREAEMNMTLEEFSRAVIALRDNFWFWEVKVMTSEKMRLSEVLAAGGEVLIELTERTPGSWGGPCLFCRVTPALHRIAGASDNGYQCLGCWRVENGVDD